MKRRILLALGAISVAVLSGCASGPQVHHTDPAHSTAWNLTRAAGYEKLKDMDSERINQKFDSNGASVPGTLAAGGLGFLSNPNGLSLPSNVGVNMLTNLVLGADVPKAGGTKIVAWIPKTEVTDNKQATREVADRVYRLVISELRDMQMPDPYHWNEIKRFDWSGYDYDETIIGDIGGGNCERESFVCHVRLDGRPLNEARKQNAVAPESLGGYPAWRVEISVSYSFYDESKWNQTELARVPLLRALDRVSKELPENYFVYVAPQTIPFKVRNNDYRFLGAPLVLRQGKTLYFLEPDKES